MENFSSKPLPSYDSSFSNRDGYNATDRQRWDDVAQGWQKWFKTIEESTQKLTHKLVELAQIKLDDKILDIGTGIGEPAVTAAKIVGETGLIVGIDISSEMISLANKRVGSLGLHNLRFIQGDIENLNSETLPVSVFDKALCRWGLMSLPNLNRGLSNIYDLLYIGGKFAAAVMGKPSEVPLINIPVTIARNQFGLEVEASMIKPGVFSLSDPKKLKTLFENARFRDLHVEEFDVVFSFPSPQIYSLFVAETIGTVRELLNGQDTSKVEKIWQKVTEYVRANFSEMGIVTMHNNSLCIVGTK